MKEEKKIGKWRSFWKKIIREKRKIRIFDCSSFTLQGATHHQVNFHHSGYDADTYAQKFDQGSMCDDDDIDILSRSFSMRFAAPSNNNTRILVDNNSDISNKVNGDNVSDSDDVVLVKVL